VRFGLTVLAPVLAFAARTAFAAPEIEAQAHFGVATVPFDVTTLAEAKGQAFVLLAGAGHALTEPLSLELRVPLVFASVAQPAGSYVDAAALGNVQLGARYRLLERRSGDAALTLSARLEAGAPTASHGEDLMANRALAIADGIEGRGYPEWFTPGVLPITASTAVRRASPRVSLEAALRLPVLVRISEAHLPSATTNTRSVGFAAVVAVELKVRLSQRLALAPAGQLFVDILPAAQRGPADSRLQDLERLSLHVHLGSSAALIVDLQTAIGGELSGAIVAGGVRVTANLR
jgi:hypothetical protein